MPLPEPPPDLPPAQHTIWHDTITQLQAQGTTHIDPRHLHAYVRTARTLQEATTSLDQHGAIIPGPHGQPTTNPAHTIHQRAARDLTRLATTLGLTRPSVVPARDNPLPPMQANDPLPKLKRWRELHGADPVPAGRWCEEHGRWEGTCHGHGGVTCHNPLRAGTNTCRMHPGGNGKVKHLAARARRDGDKVAGPLPGGRELPDVHPAEALLRQVKYWAGLCDWLNEMVAGLEQGAMVWGLVRQSVDRGENPGSATVHGAGLSTWVQWHERAHRQLANVCEIALRAEVDAAALALQQAQGMQAFRAFQEGLQSLHLSAEQWGEARKVMPQVLRALVAA